MTKLSVKRKKKIHKRIELYIFVENYRMILHLWNSKNEGKLAVLGQHLREPIKNKQRFSWHSHQKSRYYNTT
uniref:Ovule protein n=1 Tax=Globodera rostochiensis TaxID=31243 RepID=A0A914GXT0_GLORO